MKRILIVEDKEGMRRVLMEAFQEKYEVEGVARGDEAIQRAREQEYDVVITDLRLPGVDGMAVLDAFRKEQPGAQVILITAYGSVEGAVEAMRRGACDYVLKPFSISELEMKVERALAQAQTAANVACLREEISHRRGRLVGNSPPIQEVYQLIDKVVHSTIPVLILGESGTGKELVAREIHDRSPRRDRPFIAVNCAALAEGVLESELFGHERGAFTGAITSRKGRFELADGGTLFLDEIGDLPPSVQVKLLRFLQEQTFERVGGTRTIRVDVRVIAATHRDLKEAIQSGTFREDLYYRIHGVTIHLPPLRERREDIPVLVEHFLERFNREMHKRVQIPSHLMERFLTYPWPGNVRELENVVERAVVLADGAWITEQDLPPELLGTEGPSIPTLPSRGGVSETLEALEREMIRKALERHHWNQTRAARELGLKRTSLQYKMKKYHLHPPESPQTP